MTCAVTMYPKHGQCRLGDGDANTFFISPFRVTGLSKSPAADKDDLKEQYRVMKNTKPLPKDLVKLLPKACLVLRVIMACCFLFCLVLSSQALNVSLSSIFRTV